jgi:hypothetical protein
MSFASALSKVSARLRSLNSRSISAEEYAQYYDLWGGSFILHPRVLQFFHESFGIRTDFRGYFKKGECIAAIPTWGPYVAGERYALRAHRLVDRVDFGFPLLYMPIAPERKCTVLYRARFLVERQRPQLAGAFFLKNKCLSLLKQIPDALTAGKYEFRMKERKFAKFGGTLRDVQELSVEEIVGLYDRLFRERWGRKPHAIKSLPETLTRLRPFLYGKALFLPDKPVAIQINFRAETQRTICVDYINGGVDKVFKGISPGSLLSYINGRLACEEAAQKGKTLLYSYGKSDADYKDQWCDRVPRGYTGFWMP